MKRQRTLRRQKGMESKGTSRYARKKEYLARLSRKIGYKVFGFQIPNKMWK